MLVLFNKDVFIYNIRVYTTIVYTCFILSKAFELAFEIAIFIYCAEMSSTCRFDGIFRAVASNVDAATIEMCEHMLSIVHELPKKYALALRAKAGSVVTRTQFCDFCNQMEANRAQSAAAPRCPTCGAATFPDGSGEFECEAFAGFCGTFASAVDAMHPQPCSGCDLSRRQAACCAIWPAIL